MKKSLAILGLLICTTGFAYADEIATADTLNVTQQVEVQNELNKQTFDKDKFNPQNQYKQNFEKQKNDIKFDKSVNDRKFKNGQPQKFDKNKKPPKEFKKNLPPEFNKNCKPDFKPDKKMPKGEFKNHPQKPGDFKAHNKPPKHFKYKGAHKPNINKYRHSNHKNLRKNTTRRAYNHNYKRR